MDEKQKQYWQNLSDEFETILGDNLIQAGIFDRHTETGRFFIVVENDSVTSLTPVQATLKKIAGKKMPFPLIISKEFILTSLDSFPLEFLNIKYYYENTFSKEDIFQNLLLKPEDIRLQMEREVKGKVLLTRQYLLENLGNMKVINELIQASLAALLPVFKAVLVLKGEKIPNTELGLLQRTDEVTQVVLDSFRKAVELRGKKLPREKVVEFFQNYINQMVLLMNLIENWEV
jgi:hypothetical protein